MGISFKVSRTGRRVHPRPIPRSGGDTSAAAEKSDDFPDDVILGSSKKSGDSVSASSLAILPDTEASFTLSLYQDGYTVGKVSEVESANQTYSEIPKLLHPYDRASETLFSAIEAGRLPGDILDDLPCKYVNGGLVCEVRDYRKCFSDTGIILPAATNSPVIQKLHLRMSLENVVKDMPSISDGAWTYGDMMEVESRILKALQPKLCLDPTPKLDRLGENTISTKLNLGLRNMRKRLRQIPDVTVTNNIRGKKVCIDGVPESSRFGDSGFAQPLHENQPTQSNGPNSMIALRSNSSYGANASVPSSHQMGVGSPRVMQDHRPGPILSAPGASHSGQDMVITYSDNAVPGAAALQVRRDGQDVLPNSNKRPRNTSVSGYGNQQQHMGSPMDGFQGQDPNWKNTVLQQQSLVRGIQYGNTGMQKYPLPIFEGGSNQEPGSQFAQGMQFGLKEEQFEMDKQGLGQNRNEVHGLESELNQNDSQQIRLAQRVPQQVMSSTFPQIPWNNLGQPLESNTRKDDPYQKRKIVQSPRVSAGGIPQSPLSSRSGEFSSGSVGHQVGGAVTSGYLQPQKEKAGNMSVHPLGGGTSMTSSANDSMPRHHQAQMVSKRRSNSLPKNPAMSGVGSPASVSNMSMPINVGSPPVGSPPLSDPAVIDRFSKIEMITARFQLNSKKTKVEEHPARKLFSPQQLAQQFSNDLNNENFKDDSCTMPMSKSLVGGSMNVCKTRVLCFMLTESNVEGNGFPVPKARTRLIMSEKPTDGTVAFHMGDIEDNQYLSAEDYLPTLPNTHTADLLAAQFYSLMIREGYQVEDDHVQPKPTPPIHTVSNQHCTPGGNPYNAAGESQSQQYSDGVSGHPLNDANKQPSSNNLQGQRMLGPGTAQGLQISQGILSSAGMPPRPQQPDPTASQQHNQVNQHMQNQVNQQMQNQVMQNQVNQVNQQMQNQVNQVNQQMQNQVSQQQMTPSQQAQLQRSLALASNPVLNAFGQNSNAQLNNYVTNNSSHLQLQMLQQQQAQKQQQQQILQRKMMNIGNAGLGNMANSIGGYGGIGNMMGLGGVRGVGGAGISAPMGSIAGMGNMGQNPLNLGASPSINNVLSQQQLRPGGMNPIHHIMSKIRMGQNSGNMNLPVVGQAGMRGGISGARQMQMNTATTGLPMLGAAMNRGNINTMQRPMGQMGPPKLVSGNNTYFTPQQLQQMQQQQHLQQQQQQQMQQQLQQQQQQDNASSLQSVLTATQVGSPSNMGISQQVNQPNNQQQQLQQPSPQQMSQRTPMSPQLSSGAVHTMSAGNQEPAPPSPQLSSQTMNSVGSITNSPMDLQGVNKSN